MRKLASIPVLLLIALLCTASSAHGQRATERYIPVGQSPGVSGVLTTVGTIAAVEKERRRIRIAGPADGPITVAITKDTKFWLDRSEQKKQATVGSFADCQVGRTIEVKYTDPWERDTAEWVKLRVPGDS